REIRHYEYRGWSDPTTMGPLVETLVQACLRDHNMPIHFFRDYENPKDRQSPVREVDFVTEPLRELPAIEASARPFLLRVYSFCCTLRSSSESDGDATYLAFPCGFEVVRIDCPPSPCTRLSRAR